MTQAQRGLALLSCIVLCAPLAQADWLSGGVQIDISTSDVWSSGWATYRCSWLSPGGFCYLSGSHIIRNDAHTIASGSVSSVNYADTVSGIPAAGICYDAVLSVNGSEGASNTYTSGYKCSPSGTPSGGSLEVVDKCDGEAGYGNPCSPLIVNLSNGSWELSGSDDPVTFDIDADGRPNRITWTGRGEPLAFLALDRNVNGAIDDGAELFGTATVLRSGTRASNGFEALKEYDLNDDRVIDAADGIWKNLLLWTDTDHDGRSHGGEIARISDSRVVALSTDYVLTRRRDAHGNWFGYLSALHLTDGRRTYYDVYFRSVD